MTSKKKTARNTSASEKEQKTAYDDLDFITSTLSAQIRTLALSLIAITWTITISHTEKSSVLENIDLKYLHFCGLLSVAVLVFDYTQYFFGLLSTKKVIRDLENGQEADYSGCLYNLREAFFWLKQISLIAAIYYLFKSMIFVKVYLLGIPLSH